MTKTNVQSTPSNSQHHDTPNNKTHVIKFRVTAEEKASLELTCKLLNLSLSTFIRRAIHNVKIEKTVIVAGGGEETLTAVSTLLAQCSKVGGNLNQLARHFNSGGADTEQIRAKLLDELADLTAFRLHAEKVLGELYGNAQAWRLLKTRTTPPSKRTSFTSMMRSPGSNFWMSMASRSWDSYLLDTLECGDFWFATACLLANRKYGKNTQHGDIKSHQYIISFDPRDAADNGLTMEKAQALGLKFCSENFPGHPVIVCTHPDAGHDHSGNIHVHIVIGSIRTREVERKPYMQKHRDWLEGMKHSSTAQTMRHLRVEVMELCEGAGLYQIDLLNGSKERVSEAEYWARRRGQLKLDCENAALTAAGQPPKQKKFETVKDTLRRQISSVLYRATSFEDFSDKLMQQYGIAVKESRGQLSYLPAGRTKFIRARHLGDKFDKAAVLATSGKDRAQTQAQFKQDTVGKLIDIQSRMTEGKGIGYKRWLTKHNLKVMAQTVKLLQEKDLTDEDALNQRITELETKYHDSLAVVKDLEGRMKANNELHYHIAAYTSTKNVAQQLKTAKRPAVFEEQHRAELTAYRAAAAYFKANNLTKLPSPKKLEAEYAQLASEKAKFYEQYKEAKEELLKLKTAKQNVRLFPGGRTDAAGGDKGVCV